MTEWHARYGGRGVMIYWHVEKKCVCIYSPLKNIHNYYLHNMKACCATTPRWTWKSNMWTPTGKVRWALPAICWVLSFLPRLKNLKKQRLSGLERKTGINICNLPADPHSADKLGGH